MSAPIEARGQSADLLLTLSLVGNSLVSPQVVHKALMKVAETGTEAAAATGIKMIPMSGKVGPMTIVNFNRPFLLSIISKNTQSIMFFVKVVNPKQA